jgi:hypothetical protein
MTATYQLQPTGLTEQFFETLKRTFGGHPITVRVETQDEAPALKREGWVVPEKEKDDPFYSVENLRYLNKNIETGEQGKFVMKTFDELFGDLK